MSITKADFLKILVDHAEEIQRQHHERDIEFWKGVLAKYEAEIAEGKPGPRDIDWYRKRVDRPFVFQQEDEDYGADVTETDSSEFWSYLSETLDGEGATIPGVGKLEIAEDFGGEGQGDDYYVVVRFTDEAGNESYLKRHGWYASYDGGYYEGPTVLVEAVQKTITVYEEVK